MLFSVIVRVLSVLAILVIFVDSMAYGLAMSANNNLCHDIAVAAASKSNEYWAKQVAEETLNKYQSSTICHDPKMITFSYSVPTRNVTVETQLTCTLPVSCPGIEHDQIFKANDSESITGQMDY